MKQRHLPKGSRSAGCLAQAGKLLEAGLGTSTGRAESGEMGPRQTLHKDRVRVCSLEGGNSVQLLQEQEVHNQFWKSKMALGASDRTQVNEV